MAKYTIIGEPEIVAGGRNFKVVLIPEVEAEKDFREEQVYFVADDQEADDVLSAAALNHENGVKKIIEPPITQEAAQEFEAKKLEDLPEDLKNNIQK